VRCTRIEFKGFRRLADTATNIDGDITAFVGLNEAGKTSLLRALEWLSGGDVLSPLAQNRSRPPKSDKAPVVTAYFALGEDAKEVLADLEMEPRPTSLKVSRSSDNGDEATLTLLPGPKRLAKPFQDATRKLEAAYIRLKSEFEGATEVDEPDANNWADTTLKALEEPDTDWTEDEKTALRDLADWLGSPREFGRSRAVRDQALSTLLTQIHAVVDREHPAHVAAERLRPRVPLFVVFEEANRVLRKDYELSVEANRRPSPALRDLLLIAEVDIDDLWDYISLDDSTRLESLVENGNERLMRFFSQTWNQSNIAVRLNVNGTRLQLMVKELREMGAVTDIEERSDGLQTFIALAAFLASGGYHVPPILLLDEAETHLHYNAQADLVGVLLKNVDATQVFYTTHSPGCLPSDLGTGIRLLANDPDFADASVLRNNFWQDNEPGFAPLLYAMGAGAAAFSMCRKAVLSEGAADMILLPSLIRMATGEADLEYQIAPGLANAHAFNMKVEEVAAKVVYVTDGDGEGERYRNDLLGADVPANRIFHLLEGCAPEDLVHRDDYITVVNRLLTEMGVRNVRPADLDETKTISKALVDWGKANRLQLPSKVEIAYALLRHENLRLTRQGRAGLKRLHDQFVKAFT
jgi:ABC-type transport system involved in cytochrome c biogenesis ATPase subunit